MKYADYKGAQFTRDEVSSIYVDRDERFVVSFVVGYGGGTKDGITTPEQAAEAALDLTRDLGNDGTIWYVYDRLTKTMHTLEQWQFEPTQRPAVEGGAR